MTLAATYGMGGATAGAKLNKSKEEGEQLLNNFFKGFPGVKKAIDDSKEFLRKNGYVEDFIGRRRRLTDINLAPYTIALKNKINEVNPFLECANRDYGGPILAFWQQVIDGYVLLSNMHHMISDIYYKKPISWEVNHEISQQYFDNLKDLGLNPAAYYKKVLYSASESKFAKKDSTGLDKLKKDMQEVLSVIKDHKYTGRFPKLDDDGKKILDDKGKTVYSKNITVDCPEQLEPLITEYISKYGYKVPENFPTEPIIFSAWTGKIAQASRQCFNARIQGSAASLTKLAMIDIVNDPELQSCQAKLIIPVHDELLVECPAYYADRVEKRLPEVMIGAAKRVGDDVPQSCDPYCVTRWASDVCAAFILDEFKKLEKSSMSKEDATAEIIKRHPEVPENILHDVITGKVDELVF